MKQAVLFLILCFSCVAAKAQDAADVIKFVAPEKYPLAALALRAKGEVFVEVRIDSSGKVVSAGAVSGHPLLRGIAEQAARKWQFSKDFAAAKTGVQLIFDFQSAWREIEESDKREEIVTKFNHPTPFRVEVIAETLIPKFLLLPRENGEIKPAICEIHNQLMGVEIQEISYGLRADFADSKKNEKDENGKDFWEIQDEFFPNANVNSSGGCMNNGIEKEEVHFCQICRIKREEWLNNKR